MEINPIADIENDYIEKFGVPRQSGLVNSMESRIVFRPAYRDENALRGIEAYSHLWIIWGFHKNRQTESHWSPTVRPPRLGGNRRMGVFATRSPFRPNGLGLSCVEFKHLEYTARGPVLVIGGGDFMNGTPVYDIKPYLAYADAHPTAISGFADDVMKHQLKPVIAQELYEQIAEEHRETVLEILSQDPRPGYQRDEERIYGFRLGGQEMRFQVVGDEIHVVQVTSEQ